MSEGSDLISTLHPKVKGLIDALQLFDPYLHSYNVSKDHKSSSSVARLDEMTRDWRGWPQPQQQQRWVKFISVTELKSSSWCVATAAHSQPTMKILAEQMMSLHVWRQLMTNEGLLCRNNATWAGWAKGDHKEED